MFYKRSSQKTKTFHFDVTEELPLSCDSYLAKVAASTMNVSWSVDHCFQLIKKRVITLNLNRQKVDDPKTILEHGDHLSMRVPLHLFKKASKDETRDIKEAIELKEQDILWQDRWLLIARKPKGIPSQQTLDPKRDFFLAAVKRLLIKLGEKDPYLILHHRLDVETSGLMLFCRKKSLNKAVGELFKHRKIQKTYHALCKAKTLEQNSFDVKNYLAKKKERPLKMHSVTSGGDVAHTSFKVLKRHNDSMLIECKPHTGRTHQIRVHLAELGIPIIGDKVYGTPSDKPLQLHAVALEFEHPETKELIQFSDQVTSIS